MRPSPPPPPSLSLSPAPLFQLLLTGFGKNERRPLELLHRSVSWSCLGGRALYCLSTCSWPAKWCAGAAWGSLQQGGQKLYIRSFEVRIHLDVFSDVPANFNVRTLCTLVEARDCHLFLSGSGHEAASPASRNSKPYHGNMKPRMWKMELWM